MSESFAPYWVLMLYVNIVSESHISFSKFVEFMR